MKVRWATLFKLRSRNTVLVYKIVALHVPDENSCNWNLKIGIWSGIKGFSGGTVTARSGSKLTSTVMYSDTRVFLLVVCN